MKLPHRCLPCLAPGFAVVAAIALTVGFSDFAWSQSARTIKLIVPFPPGGGIDALGRILAEEISHAQKTSMVVENRPGAGTLIATESVLRSPPDGMTVLLNNNSSIVIPNLRKVSYDPLADIVPICRLATTSTVVVVNAKSPYRTLDDLIRAARAKPGELTWGGAAASTLTIGFEMLQHAANFKMAFVPFAGPPQALSALLGDHIVAAIADYPAAAGQLQSKSVRALVTGSRTRIPDLPDVPTAIEAGIKDYELELWYAPFVVAGTPKDVIARYEDWFSQAVQAPAVKLKLASQQINVKVTCGQDFAVELRRLNEEYGRAIREANLKIE